MTIDVSSIGIKFENFMQAGCRDLGLLRGCTVFCTVVRGANKKILAFLHIRKDIHSCIQKIISKKFSGF